MITRPILFSGAMVRALLDGSKTQTRRIVKDLPPWPITEICHDSGGTGKWMPNGPAPSGTGMAAGHWRLCPYGQPGDHLWVRETFLDTLGTGVEHRDESGLRHRYAFAADCAPGSYGDQTRKDYGLKWKPSIHMPRAASRILLEIVSVRVERLSEISVSDCHSEGIGQCDGLGNNEEILGLARRMGTFEQDVLRYATLWESINGAGSWVDNPWVWVVEFKRVAP